MKTSERSEYEKAVRVLVLLSPAQHEALKAEARRQRRTVSSLIREAVERMLGVPDTTMPGGHA